MVMVVEGTGMMMIPVKLAAKDGYVGFEYVPSFGVSCLILTLILLYTVAWVRHTPIKWDVKVSVLPTFVSGLFWSIGNIGGILASLSPLGQTTGFPLTQVGDYTVLFYFQVASGLFPMVVELNVA
jgi:hypothetical protein